MITLDHCPEAEKHIIRDTVARALAEDLGPADVTTQATIPPGLEATGVFRAKEPGVLAGLAVVSECFAQLNTEVRFSPSKQWGETFQSGDGLAQIQGPASALLTGERTAINFLQRLCGVATVTRKFVEAVASTGVTIVDTRKTTPGMRVLERAAVRAGGGKNHRFALFDGLILKDNHIRLAGGITQAVQAARDLAHHLFKVQVEVTNLEQLAEALHAGAELIMLDNMSLEMTKQAVKAIAGRALIEASGGIDLDNVAQVAAAGVDFISVGALTHSAPAVDISLELEPI